MLDSLRTPGFWEYIIGSYVYYLPMVLYSIWAPVSIFDLSRREDVKGFMNTVWILVIFLIPVIGGALYLLFSNADMKKSIRYTMVFGGLGIFLLLLFISNLMGV